MMTSDSLDTAEVKVEIEDCSDTEIGTIVASILNPNNKRKRKPRQIWSPDGAGNSSCSTEDIQVDDPPPHPILQVSRLKPQHPIIPGKAKAVSRAGHKTFRRNKSALSQKPHGSVKNTMPTVHSHMQKEVGRGHSLSFDGHFLPITSEKGCGLRGIFRQEDPSGQLVATARALSPSIIAPKPIAVEFGSIQGKVPGIARPCNNGGTRGSMSATEIDLTDDVVHTPMKSHKDMSLNIEQPETLVFVTEDTGDQQSRTVRVEDYSVKEILLQVVQDIKDLKELFLLERSHIAERLEFISQQLNETHLQSSSSTELENLYSFPLESITGLNTLAIDVENNKNYRMFLAQYLKEHSSNLLYKCVGEKQLSAVLNKTVNDMCSTIMTNSLASNFCMKGRTAGKYSFEDNYKSIIEVIFQGVKLKIGARNIQVDIFAVKQSIGEWLRQAKSRASRSGNAYNFE